jgi:hypothetical protein
VLMMMLPPSWGGVMQQAKRGDLQMVHGDGIWALSLSRARARERKAQSPTAFKCVRVKMGARTHSHTHTAHRSHARIDENTALIKP